MSSDLILTVAIATYNRREVLRRTLPTVLAQDFAADRYEVVVVVDGSTDGTAEMLRSFSASCPLRVIEQANRGLPSARNAGWRAARGRYVLFLDDDLECAPGLVAAHVAARDALTPQVVFGPIYVSGHSPRSLAVDWTERWARRYYGRLERERDVRWPESVLVDPNTSLPRSLLAACDGFDERCARYGESAELGLRLWGSGVRFRYEGAAITYQLYVKTARDVVLKDAWWFGRNEVYLCRKFPQYRAASALRGLGAGSPWKRTLREMASRSPVSPELLLRPPYWLAERFRRLAFARNAGIRLLDLRQRISNFRGALSEEGAWKELVGEFGMRLPVLMYHNVSPRRHTRHPELVVSPEAFARQLDLLKKRGYHAIRPSQWLGWVRLGERLPERPLLLTFDDGYADIAKYALPLLQEHGFQAVVFLPTALLGGANPWDGEPLMNREQAIAWAGRGIDFGAHGRKHPDLTRLSSDELEEEIAGSARDLCTLLGRPAVSFAYPYGRCDERVQQAVSRHFAMAFGINEGLNRLETEVMNLRRTMVQPNDTWLDYRSRLSSGRSRFHRFRASLAAFRKRQ